MGVSLSLSLVEHSVYVEHGPAALRRLEAGELEPVRALLFELLESPWVVQEALIAERRARLAKLEELRAPDLVLRNEERRIARLEGQGRSPEAVRAADAEQLRGLLHAWGRHGEELFFLDKSWDLIHWFADPARRERPTPGPPARSAQTLVDQALFGSQPVPLELPGHPLWGDPSEEGSAYNPPGTAQAIHLLLDTLDTAAWEAVNEELSEVAVELAPYASSPGDPGDLDFARNYFSRLRLAYETAAAKGLGVSCDWHV